MNVYRSTAKVRSSVKRVLFVSNKQGAARQVVEEACSLLGVDLEIVGGDRRVVDVVPHYNSADVVIGIGLVVLEASSCDRPVINFDYQGGEGPVSDDNVYDLRSHNFSGRRRRLWYTSDGLAGSILRTHAGYTSLLPYLRVEHDVSSVANRYLELAANFRSKQFASSRHALASAILRSSRKFSSVRLTSGVSRARGFRQTYSL